MRSDSSGSARLLPVALSVHSATIDTAHAPPFHALSYIWGTETTTEEMELGGKRFAVTPHLRTGLRALGRRFADALFWIDAICINQTDDAEKATQVGRMSDIYLLAACVVIWLGPARDNSDLFMTQVTRLNDAFASIPDVKMLERDALPDHGLPPIEDEVWLAIRRFDGLPWAQRLWVLQEAVLAEEAVVVCGDHAVDLEDMLTVCGYLTRIWSHLLEEPPSSASVVDAFVILWGLRKSRQRDGCDSLADVLFMSTGRRCREAVDKVYGFLGLVSAEVRAKIAVDYTLQSRDNFWKLYIQVSSMLLQTRDYLLLDMAVSEHRHAALPTWCPDFRDDPSVRTYHFSDFEAGLPQYPGDFDGLPVPPVSFVHPDGLQVCGVVMDRVKTVVELSVSTAQQLRLCETRCLELSSEVYVSREAAPLEHIATLVAGTDTEWSLYEAPRVVEDYGHWKVWMLQKTATDDRARGSTADPEGRAAAREYNSCLEAAWQGNAFFSTENGRVGIGPGALRQGDSVHVLFHARAPYLLRFDESRQAHSLVGPAYVHGLMGGEAFRAADPIQTHERFLLR